MKPLFKSTADFDKRAVNSGLGELILQENVACATTNLVKQKLSLGAKILFLCGGGNNGADAIATARALNGDYKCEIFLTSENLCENARIQLNIAKNFGVKIVRELSLDGVSCVIDGIFGSGLNRDLTPEFISLIEKINEFIALKIAIDFPSGLDIDGNVRGACFRADFCLCAGALKTGLFSDFAKDFTGEIICVNLGVAASEFTYFQEDFLLEKSDLVLPFRYMQNVNKGDFGHAFVALGEMSGAGSLCALAALKIGAGKVSIVGNAPNLDSQIMRKANFKGASAVALGMGLGDVKINFEQIAHLPCVVDADMCYHAEVTEFARSPKVVLTPHPKEFVALCKTLGFKNVNLDEVLRNKFDLAREFSREFHCVLVLKGANSLIASGGVLYICDLGRAKLAVGGSGDVLSGIILGYLAQGFSALEAAKNGVLAHALSGEKYGGNDYSLTPADLIEGLKCL